MKHLALALIAAATPALADPDITVAPPQSLAWETTPEGVAFAALSGDRWSEAYFAMVRLPGGTISPPHVKSADMFGVMVEGQMTHATLGQKDPTIIGPGSYYHVPAHLPHISSCVSDTPCVTMLYQDGAFDFVPVQP
ncbi:cupin domain-containing protein [uncultured Tateyamaria sp.]|uniref:cupin domain-containing protein n=1 Tax=uncultured Tateyamaria sp. TaxID=455651 RepID=UPI002623DA0C|nr:cupin domain-containing protein [uncultured Tateyamaria sp.]